MISLTCNTQALLPEDHIVDLEYVRESGTSTEVDIYGSPINVALENRIGNTLWVLSSAYIDLSYVQQHITAYSSKSVCYLTVETGTRYAVVIKEYPVIERVKTVTGDVIYNVKLHLQAQGGDTDPFKIPVTNPNSTRLFSR